MLRIEIYINKRRIAVADATNVKGEVVSDYLCSATTGPNPYTGSDRRLDSFMIQGHRRRRSVWALVAKIATRLVENERKRGAYLAGRARLQDEEGRL